MEGNRHQLRAPRQGQATVGTRVNEVRTKWNALTDQPVALIHSTGVEGVTEQRHLFSLSYTSQEKAMAPHSSTLAWKIPWTKEPGKLKSMGSLRAGHD